MDGQWLLHNLIGDETKRRKRRNDSISDFMANGDPCWTTHKKEEKIDSLQLRTND